MIRHLYILVVLFFVFCSKTVTKSPSGGCFSQCNQNYFLCLYIVSESLPKNKPSSINNEAIVSASCDPGACRARCTGQALATYQQNQR